MTSNQLRLVFKNLNPVSQEATTHPLLLIY